METVSLLGREIPVRVPVLSEEQGRTFSVEAINREWLLVTEAARRGVLGSHDFRSTIINFCTQPVTEQDPITFLDVASSGDSTISNLGNRYRAGLVSYLSLPQIPDDIIVKRIFISYY